MDAVSLILTNDNHDIPKKVVFLCLSEECEEFEEAFKRASLSSDDLIFDDTTVQTYPGSDVYYAAVTLDTHFILSDTVRPGRYSEFSRTLMALLDSPSTGVEALERLFQ